MISRRALVVLMTTSAAAPSFANAQASQAGMPHLKRGMNLSKWLDRPVLNKTRTSYAQVIPQDSRTVRVRDLNRLKALGIDFVRIAVDPGPPILDPGLLDRWTAEILRACREVRGAGLNLILTLQPENYTAKFTTDALLGDAALYASYRATLRSLASTLASLESGAIIEPTNEPSMGCRDAEGWTQMQAELIADVRGVSQTLPIVLKGWRCAPCRDSRTR